jgi:dCTP deaminase
MILNDKQILNRVLSENMIEGFISEQIRKVDDLKVISYGLSSFGYDISLSTEHFKVFRHCPGKVVNPKNFNPQHLETLKLQSDEYGQYFIMPAHSYGLGVAIERLNIPRDITVICVGKSTYARSGVIANITPAESGWSGHLTLEFANTSHADCRIYANEGVAQLLFFQGDDCGVSYADRNGKYQNQAETVVLPRV